MEEESKKIIIELHKCQYNYIYDLLHETYKFLSKLPKNRRSNKFYVLEILVATVFDSISE